MEIILDNVSYDVKVMDEKLLNVSYTFSSGITFCSGLSGKVIKELLFQEKKISAGYVMVSGKAKVYDVCYVGDEVSFSKETIYQELVYLNDYYKLGYKDIEKRIINALKICDVSLDWMNVKFDNMSEEMLKLMQLVKGMFLKSKIFLLDYFDKGMDDKDVNYVKKLLYKLNKMYNKSVIIFSNDLERYMSIVNDVVVFLDGKVVYKGDKSSFYDDKLYKYIDMPYIIHYVKYLEINGHKFDKYIDIKELLKAIFRDVENK